MTMFNITLLSSFHKIHGKCNPDELYKIIEEIQPEIIFEELCVDSFNFVYSDGYIPKTLEVFTIKKYMQKYSVRQFPVDSYPVNETDLFSDAQLISDNSTEYNELWNQKLLKLYQSAYSFLNSDECSDIINKLRIIEETVLTQINNVKLINQHKTEKALNDKRESEMLINIYNYSNLYLFDKAIFICGAEHRQPLKEKIKEYEGAENSKLNWTFYK